MNFNILQLLLEGYRNNKIKRFIIDEVHCYIEWGMTFRNEYLNLQRLKIVFPEVQICCFSATLNTAVIEKIVNELRLIDVNV